MVLSKEQRNEYLKKAREAKALKKLNKEPEPIKEEVIKEPEPIKVNKIKKVNKSLDLTKIPDNIPPQPKPKIEIENEEVIEVIEEIVKIKKPKRIIKKIIKQEYESETDEEIIEEVIKPVLKQKHRHSKIEEPKEVIKSSFFNY
jgi:hypothetical protein